MFNKKNLLWVIGIGILFPLFFQLNGQIYKEIVPITDSQGDFLKVPIPVSVLVCLGGLFFLVRKITRIIPALLLSLGMLFAGLLSLWLAGDDVTSHQRKLIMIVQVLLPMSGLYLGQLVDDPEDKIAKAFLVVVSTIVPLQLLATWLQGGLILSHYLYAFSIYSHFQYVTLVFVCAFAYAQTSLWDKQKVWLCFLGVAMAIYAVSSLSFLTIFAYFSFILIFALSRLLVSRPSGAKSALIGILIVITSMGAYTYFKKMDGHRTSVEGDTGFFHSKFKTLAEGKIPSNVQERFGDWALFGRAIIENKTTLLVGHAEPMPREIRSSPHNFYIDIAYTFGLLGLLPIVGLIGYTAYLCWQRRKYLSGSTWWLIAIVAYLVLIDSNFKVTLRQPYPGIFAYFLWGLLLTRLQLVMPGKLGA